MSEKRIDFTVSAGTAGFRLDRFLAQSIPGSSRSFLQKLVRDGRVSVDGTVTETPRFPVRGGQTVAVRMPEPAAEQTLPAAEPFAFDILYEDEAMLVIDKPAGVVVHPAAGNPDGTVVNALLGRYPELAVSFAGSTVRPGIVHRLDKDTSGVLVIAKTPEAQFKLGASFAKHETAKTYLALTRGIPRTPAGVVRGLIGRHPVNRQKMAVVERNGKLAVTNFRVAGTGAIDGVPVALLEVKIETGRTHQIRVHLASLGFPVLGDALYGGARSAVTGVGRQMLHAWKLSIPHPAGNGRMEFTAPVPEDFAANLERMRQGRIENTRQS